MDTFFILISPDKEQGVDTLYGIYTELQMLHSKVLEIMETKQDNIEKLMIAQLVEGNIYPILSMKDFDKVMKCLEEDVDENALKKVIESKNVDFIVAFLKEIISPEEDPRMEQRKKYSNVLKVFKELLPKELSLYQDVCDAGIHMYK